jgi:hypothetical protein
VPIAGRLVLLVPDVADVAPTPPLPPVCAAGGITGDLRERTVFCVSLMDQGGHEGEADCTAPVALGAIP